MGLDLAPFSEKIKNHWYKQNCGINRTAVELPRVDPI